LLEARGGIVCKRGAGSEILSIRCPKFVKNTPTFKKTIDGWLHGLHLHKFS